MQPKIVIFSAPSGTGKSTIINRLSNDPQVPEMKFSVSATSRPPRGNERDGVEYRFLTADEFRRRIADGEFVEYEEVYPGRFYGTLKSEIDRILESGHHCVLDLDVKGALNVKKLYGDRALALFIQPPSIDALRRRLEGRNTDSAADIEKRLERAGYELAQAPAFDRVVVNDDLEKAVKEVADACTTFLKNE